MPYVLKPNKLFARDPEHSDQYLPQNVVTDRLTGELVADINEAGAAQVTAVTEAGAATISNVQQAVADSQAAVDGIDAQRDSMIASIAAVAGQGTDTTLTQSGVAADAAAVGGLKSAFEEEVTKSEVISVTSESTRNIYCDKSLSLQGGDRFSVKILSWTAILSERSQINVYVHDPSSETGLKKIGEFNKDAVPSDLTSFTVPEGSYTGIRVAFQNVSGVTGKSASVLILYGSGVMDRRIKQLEDSFPVTEQNIFDGAVTENKITFAQEIFNKKRLDAILPVVSFPLNVDNTDVIRGVLTENDGDLVTTPRSDSGAYYYMSFDVSLAKTISVSTRVGASSTYPRYVFIVDEDFHIIAKSPEINYQTAHVDTYDFVLDDFKINKNASMKMYVMCNTSNPGMIKDFVSGQVVSYAPIGDSINSLSQFPAMKVDPYLQEYAWNQAKDTLAGMYDYDIIFTLITDSHTNDEDREEGGKSGNLFMDTFAATGRITRLPMVDFCVNLGDIITAGWKTTRSDIVKKMSNALDMLDRTKLYSIIGNHEKNAKHKAGSNPTENDDPDFAEGFTPGNLYNLLLKQKNVTYGGDGSYYCMDFDRFKIRFAFLNNYDHPDYPARESVGPRSEAQLGFLRDVVFADDGYYVILFMHTFPIKASDVSACSEFISLLQSKADRIICIFRGHEHKDLYGYYGENHTLPYYIFTSSYRNANTIGTDRLTLNIIGIRTSDRTVKMKRIGYINPNPESPTGYDANKERSFTYQAYPSVNE